MSKLFFHLFVDLNWYLFLSYDIIKNVPAMHGAWLNELQSPPWFLFNARPNSYDKPD